MIMNCTSKLKVEPTCKETCCLCLPRYQLHNKYRTVTWTHLLLAFLMCRWKSKSYIWYLHNPEWLCHHNLKMYAWAHSLNMFTNRGKKMIYIQIRPVSELRSAVCLGRGTFTVQLHGSAAGAGLHDCSPKRLTGEEGSGSTDTRLRQRVS